MNTYNLFLKSIISKTLDFNRRCISALLIICTTFTFMGCFTTNNIYDEQEIEISYTFVDSRIISHQNNMGVLYYTIEPVYTNPAYGELIITELEIGEQIKYNHLTNREFPYSTYSDAVLYRDNHTFPDKITVKQHKKELLKSEKVFSPGKTICAIGIPISVLLTVILGAVLSRNDAPNNKK